MSEMQGNALPHCSWRQGKRLLPCLPEGFIMLKAEEIYKILLTAYGKPRWWSDDPFIVMFQSVLVQNTTWRIVEKTCASIEDKLTPEYIENLPAEELEQLISPCGFYKAKARTIQALAAWYRRYQFDRQKVQNIPMADLRKELLSIRGIGAETADVILVYAFYQPSFVVDAYTRRFLLRIGYEFTDDTAIKNFFETGLPKEAELYGRYHWLLLEHCISACKKSPQCDQCKLKERCKYNGKEEKDNEKIIYSDPPRKI